MSEVQPNADEGVKIGHALRSLEFNIAAKIARDGDKTDWLDSFRNLFVPISGQIDFATIGMGDPLPQGKENEILALREQILEESKKNRPVVEAQEAIAPLINRLAEFFD